ncbi:GlxA family transcriptional regulator [Egicoccus sp. AB-alg2]|uniref:GlxA family transcriptional regulator n=1 Tax=Egicoccus sp. AB-alg2 TaxID=3242693 RepID=UPI00359E1A85
MFETFLPATSELRAMGHRVAAVVLDEANPFEFSVAAEVFGVHRPEIPGWDYDFRLAAPRRSVRLAGGIELRTPYDIDAVAGADTVVLPALNPFGDVSTDLLDAVRHAHAGGARVVSFCSGAFLVAETGLLDGRRATTHWMYTDLFRERFPRVRLDPNVLFVDEGDVLTSAGTAAGIDLSLHIVRKDLGAEAARVVARRMVVPPHRDGGQAQFIDGAAEPRVRADDLAGVLEWARRHLEEDLSVAVLAGRANMSERTFARRFKESTGTTPFRWLLTQRLQRAQELLETSDLDVDHIAVRAGFGTSTNLREHFRRELRTTPSAYRRCFVGTRPPATPLPDRRSA